MDKHTSKIVLWDSSSPKKDEKPTQSVIAPGDPFKLPFSNAWIIDTRNPNNNIDELVKPVSKICY